MSRQCVLNALLSPLHFEPTCSCNMFPRVGLKLYLDLGLKLTKVHRVLEFSQRKWLKYYIDFNMLLKRGMGNGEWGMGNGEWEMGNGEWGMGNGE